MAALICPWDVHVSLIKSQFYPLFCPASLMIFWEYMSMLINESYSMGWPKVEKIGFGGVKGMLLLRRGSWWEDERCKFVSASINNATHSQALIREG
jgi:hypothetical protein